MIQILSGPSIKSRGFTIGTGIVVLVLKLLFSCVFFSFTISISKIIRSLILIL